MPAEGAHLYPARSILVADTTPFYESAMVMPVLRSLRSAYHPSALLIASATGTCELGRRCGLVEDAIDLGSLHRSARSARAFLRFFRSVRRFEVDLVVDLNLSLATQLLSRLVLRAQTVTVAGLDILTALAGAREKRSAKGARDPFVRGELALKSLGIATGTRTLDVELSRDEDLALERTLASAGFKGGAPLVLLHSPDAVRSIRWPVSSYAGVAARLANNFGAWPIVADEPGATDFTRLTGAVLRSAIRLPNPHVMQLVAATARATVVITQSYAISQIAKEFATPAIDPTGCTPDEVHDLAAEVIQAGRSESLFRR